MITEKITDNQTITVESDARTAYRSMGDSVYQAESTTYSDAYREHLDRALHNECVAVPEEEYEDLRRYTQSARTESPVRARATEEEASLPTSQAKPAEPEKETVRVFNQKRAVWLAVYVLLALGVVLALVFTLPGTAWERKSITVAKTDLYPTAAAEPAAVETNVNTICTLDGALVEVELAPYAEQKPTTNWFDSLCDWLNSAIGG